MEFLGKEFEGDVAPKVDVFGLIHYAHAAAAKLADDPVMGDSLAVQDCDLGISHTY